MLKPMTVRLIMLGGTAYHGPGLETVTRALFECLMFLELGDDEAVDPDSAVALMESVSHVLSELPHDDRVALVQLAQQQAAQESLPARRDFLASLGSGLGLLDEDLSDIRCRKSQTKPAAPLHGRRCGHHSTRTTSTPPARAYSRPRCVSSRRPGPRDAGCPCRLRLRSHPAAVPATPEWRPARGGALPVVR
jgi:hypothetical protein